VRSPCRTLGRARGGGGALARCSGGSKPQAGARGEAARGRELEAEKIECELTELRRAYDEERELASRLQVEIRERSAREVELWAAGEYEAAGMMRDEQEQMQAQLREMQRPQAGSVAASAAEQTAEVRRTEVKGVPLPSTNETVDIVLIDTPGHGDLTVGTEKSFSKVLGEIHRRLDLERRRDRDLLPSPPDCTSRSTRKKRHNELVHLCLYFIAPHRMKQVDFDWMQQLHELVPLVVVIAKADTMTDAETAQYKEKVRDTLRQRQLNTFSFWTAMPHEVRLVEARARCVPPPETPHAREVAALREDNAQLRARLGERDSADQVAGRDLASAPAMQPAPASEKERALLK